ncbi:daptide-type RiPP [Paenibacillus pasadenensis]|nr:MULTISPECIES: daptide-type RiPP [Paenibacillus]
MNEISLQLEELEAVAAPGWQDTVVIIAIGLGIAALT